METSIYGAGFRVCREQGVYHVGIIFPHCMLTTSKRMGACRGFVFFVGFRHYGLGMLQV